MSSCGDSTQDGAFIQSRRYDSDGKKGTFPIVDCLEIDLSVNTIADLSNANLEGRDDCHPTKTRRIQKIFNRAQRK